jgi:hypothetical protein
MRYRALSVTMEDERKRTIPYSPYARARKAATMLHLLKTSVSALLMLLLVEGWHANAQLLPPSNETPWPCWRSA